MADNVFEWVEAKVSDIHQLSTRLRQSDLDELEAIGHIGGHFALTYSLRTSEKAWTAHINGVPVAMFGVAQCHWNRAYGAVWMLGADELEKCPVQFLHESKRALAEMLKLYPVLVNFVDCRHEKAIKWLEWLGAELDEARPYGEAGLPFHFFKLRR